METKKEIFNKIKDKISNEDLRYFIKYTELKREAEEKLNEEWRREFEYLK